MIKGNNSNHKKDAEGYGTQNERHRVVRHTERAALGKDGTWKERNYDGTARVNNNNNNDNFY